MFCAVATPDTMWIPRSASSASVSKQRLFPLLITVLCCPVLCCALLWCAVLCCGVLFCGVLCSAVVCCTVLWCAIIRSDFTALRRYVSSQCLTGALPRYRYVFSQCQLIITDSNKSYSPTTRQY